MNPRGGVRARCRNCLRGSFHGAPSQACSPTMETVPSAGKQFQTSILNPARGGRAGGPGCHQRDGHAPPWPHGKPLGGPCVGGPRWCAGWIAPPRLLPITVATWGDGAVVNEGQVKPTGR